MFSSLSYDVVQNVLSFCRVEDLYNLSITCHEGRKHVTEFIKRVDYIGTSLNTKFFYWIMRHAEQLKFPLHFGMGPPLSIMQSLDMHIKCRSNHLEVCNMHCMDALIFLRMCTEVKFYLNTDIESCRIDADVFKLSSVQHWARTHKKIKCKNVCIYSSSGKQDLCIVLKLFSEIQTLVLRSGNMSNGSFCVTCDSATLFNVKPDCDQAIAFKKLFCSCKTLFQMDRFHVCNSSCRLLRKLLLIRYRLPKFIVMNNFPNKLKKHFLKLGSCIGGSSLPNEKPISIPMRTNMAFVLPHLIMNSVP